MPTSVSGKRLTLEVCVTTADEAVVAVASGADRLEVCSTLEVGGITPSPGTWAEIRAAVSVPLVVLIRPRPGNFISTPGEFRTICRDADWFLAAGAAAVVCGVLGEDGRLAAGRCRELVKLSGGRAVLHRGFDLLPDLYTGLRTAIDVGFARVLTSGGAGSAAGGAGTIRGLIAAAAGTIDVLPGGGIKPENVAEVVRVTGCDQVHASLRTSIPGDGDSPARAAMGSTTRTDPALVAAVRAALDRLGAG
jgi:copper homeostasis protein